MKTLKEVMTRPVRTAEPDTTLGEIAELMREEDTGAIPICENEKLVGIITDRDIVMRTLAQDIDPSTIHARDIMTSPVVTCYDDEDIEIAAEVMEDKQIRRLVVIDRDEQLVGMVSIGNLAARGGDIPLVGQIIEKVTEPSHHPRI